ncbi:MAG: N-6 DNA methylase [Candidatus Dojkabacteria bacterium]|nr:MAG: N-6 DNA methylase [Candidatus Dojkabacteria bacterium]
MNLINKKLLQQKMHSFEFPNAERLEIAKKLLEGWQKALKDSDLEKTKEKSVQGKFLSTFFEAILGYSDVTTGNEEWTLIQHPRIENDSKEPDGSLGWFSKETKLTKAVIELKDAKTQLDKRQNRGSEKLTPIEQAYLYATKYDGCNWIIVSNFKEIRLYNKHKTQEYYEKFDVIDLIQENELKRFYFLLSQENLISKEKESIIDVLAKDTTEAEQDITKKFYSEYKEVRLGLLNHLSQNNPTVNKVLLLEKTQKLLDRFIFTLFCEDTSSLLPLNIVKNTYDRAINSLSPSDERVWTEFKGLFIAIDKGNNRVKPPINAYNGGLFAFDDLLDNLSIKDDFWSHLMHLAEYDFETDLNVNILGHIFEQSISDLETIKENIHLELEQGGNLLTESGDKVVIGTVDKSVEKKGRRKKDGIFYTPEYITRYIVENTVGKYLEEYPDKLSTIKILDPACGSGAFLNQAHSFLRNEYKARYDALIAEKQAKGESQTLFDYNPAENNKSILLNNLYGVDLNQESVEITKLALWLKTARSSEPLQNLDKNIKCGNSLIDDPEIAGNKAFNWNAEFKDIMQDGGFDVIIGNPPWGAELKPNEKKYISENYKHTEYQFETYIAFIEKSLMLVKENGYIGFIVPSTWLAMHYFEKIRQLLLENKLIIVELLKYQAFQEVTAETSILVCQKSSVIKHYEIQTRSIKQLESFINQERSIANSDTWRKNISNGFNLDYDENSIKIIDKIFSKAVRLDEVAKPTVGIKPYQKGKGKPAQDEDIVRKRIYDGIDKKDDSYQKYIIGGDIKQFFISDSSRWLAYGEWLAEPRNSLDFSQKKIVIRQTADRIICAVDVQGRLNLNNVYNLTLKTEGISLESLATILNSTLIGFVYRFLVPEKGRVFPEVKSVNLSKIPINIPTKDIQQDLALLYKQIEKAIELYEGLNIQSLSFLNNYLHFDGKFSIKGELIDMGWNELVEIIEQKKIKMTLDKTEELFNWFKSKQNELRNLQSQISNLGKQIDQRVYKIYELTPEEIAIIEKSQ